MEDYFFGDFFGMFVYLASIEASRAISRRNQIKWHVFQLL